MDPWPVQACGELPPAGTQDYTDLQAVATEVLWALSGRQFGTQTVTLRPCRQSCYEGPTPWPGLVGSWAPALWNGQWINLSCSSCRASGRGCSCTRVDEIFLPGPAVSLVELTIGGEAIPTGSFRIDDQGWLVRQDGGTLPACQDLSKPAGSDGAWAATYVMGEPVPAGGARSMGEMMSEMWLACSGDKSCRLPRRAQMVVKQGITISAIDPREFLKDGKTGLDFTDLWLSTVNPQARPQAARISSPDYDPGRVQTWP